jgi:cobalt-zinc-cadmium efflux system protein
MHSDHEHHSARFDRAFAWGVILNLGFIAVEVVAGLMVNSLALLADAGHNLSDVLGLVLAWGASYLVRRPPTARHTYGWRRSSVLAALLNAILLLMALGAICWEAVQRFAAPATVNGSMVMIVAGIGVVINGTTAWLFASGHHDVNIRGAYLHMFADAAISMGVVIAGLLIKFTNWVWIDPAVSLAVAVIIAITTWSLFTESLNLAFDAVPAGIDPAEVRAYLASLVGVTEVHDLHIWAMSTTETALTAHIVIPTAPSNEELLAEAADVLHDRFGIAYATIQIENARRDQPCRQAGAAL